MSHHRVRIRELSLNAMLVTVVGIGVVWNLPVSPIQRSLATPLQPVAAATGLDQRWQMYAPNPIRRKEHVEVVVTMADGTVKSWTNMRGDLVVGPFVWYRWQKLKENLVRDPGVRAGVAQWVVAELTAPGERAQQVTMTLRTEQLPPPGYHGQGETAAEVLYDEVIGPQP